MGDLRSKLRAKFPRRHSGIPPLPSSKRGNGSSTSNNSVEFDPPVNALKLRDAETATVVPEDQHGSHSRPATGTPEGEGSLMDKLRQGAKHLSAKGIAVVADAFPPSGSNSPTANSPRTKNATNGPSLPEGPNSAEGHGPNETDRRFSTATSKLSSVIESPPDAGEPTLPPASPAPADAPKSTVSADVVRTVRISDLPVSSDPTSTPSRTAAAARVHRPTSAYEPHEDPVGPTPNPQLRPSNSVTRPLGPPRRQSLLPRGQTTLIRTLLSPPNADAPDLPTADQLLPISAIMMTRKLWVKRPSASATLVTINEEDLVDDVRELILRKYGNSLGRQFDAPDLTLRIVPREPQRQERFLGPEEPMARTLDAYFPGGQTVDEALVIDIPHRRTPRASPRNGPPHAQHISSVSYEEIRPLEASTDYFGPGAVAHIPVTIAGPAANGTTHSISVLSTGQVPQIPSPGGTRTRYRDRADRPRLGRQHTSSPTILNVGAGGGHGAAIAVAANHGMHQSATNPRSRTHSNASADQANPAQSIPAAPPLPTPPSQEPTSSPITVAGTPPARAASPRPLPAIRPKKKKTTDAPALPAGMLNGGVPPINVLIVEDNIINLRLLEAFVKRLKVRWQTAMNGREAVTKWRAGGFHLVLMDIQLPVMSGLEATREIRRLERMNSIGAFNNNNGNTRGAADEARSETTEEDKLNNRDMFKSPVIIVALTASSLQSDRHEALAAGCNDFLTKPVTYVWLERKVMEWGCMQALIDFDGWRKWKSYTSQKPEIEEGPRKARAKKNRAVPNNSSSDNT
ncbi:hypothetical protein BT67DRAFT_382723 [Trichocladium antarcticum]|uniref:Response regulatory domain-containing protein n=1 Tax=Trichocladium antarcticum TaxID=1450529 RepID=A0AAN6ZD64_9PEZI|nr:hypothetical protein BT67DRAFT_382723 [Trichocladium antarcticum]